MDDVTLGMKLATKIMTHLQAVGLLSEMKGDEYNKAHNIISSIIDTLADRPFSSSRLPWEPPR